MKALMDKPAKHFYEFGAFRIDAAERLLLRDGEVVPLTPKVFDILLVLVQNSGHILEKDEVMKIVWPDQFVEEGNLARNVSTLRKALGESRHEPQYIETIPWRGYRFVASVREFSDEGADLILEKHTRSHVIIQEEEEELEEASPKAVESVVLRPLPSAPLSWRSRKNLKLLLPALLLIGLVAAIYYFWAFRKPKQSVAESPIRSIAVLPFKPLSADGSDEYLGLGVADTLITRLSGISQIVIRPTTAVRKYTDSQQEPVEVGRELKVDSVLDGSLQRSGDRIRVTVRLVRVADAKTLWAGTFDEYFTDIFKVEDSISEKVAGALMLQLTTDERRLLTKRYTENVEAYQLYLKGRYYWNKRTAEGLRKGIEYFQQALATDPNYAPAYAGLADSYSMLGEYTGLPPQEFHSKARAAATKALEIDDTLAEAHTALGYLNARDWNWSGVEKEFKRAIEINPGYATAHQWYSNYLELTDRQPEAIAEAQRAQELDPLSLIINQSLAYRLYYARRYDQAIEQSLKTLEIDPNFAEAHLVLGYVYLQKGMSEEALAELNKARQLQQDAPWILPSLGYAYAVSGKRGEAQKVIAELKEQAKQRYVPPEEMARVYIGLGEKDQAFTWLEKAYEEHSDYIVFVKVDPVWDDLRSDPRFTDLLRRIGLAL